MVPLLVENCRTVRSQVFMWRIRLYTLVAVRSAQRHVKSDSGCIKEIGDFLPLVRTFVHLSTSALCDELVMNGVPALSKQLTPTGIKKMDVDGSAYMPRKSKGSLPSTSSVAGVLLDPGSAFGSTLKTLVAETEPPLVMQYSKGSPRSNTRVYP